MGLEKFTPVSDEPVGAKENQIVDQSTIEQPVEKGVETVLEPVMETVQEKKPENTPEPVGRTDWSDDREAARMSAHDDLNRRIEKRYRELGEKEFEKSGIDRSTLSPDELRRKIRSLGEDAFDEITRQKRMQKEIDEETDRRRRIKELEMKKFNEEYDKEHPIETLFYKGWDFLRGKIKNILSIK